MTAHARRWWALYRDRYRRNFAFVHINKTAGTSIEAALGVTHRHETAMEMRDRIGRRRWDERFTFTVVRNPWDRVVSQYGWRYRSSPADAPPFRDWVRLAYEEHDPAYYYNPKMFMPQWFWVADEDGNNLVDFVGRFENLQHDFGVVADRIGVTSTLPHERPSEHAHYSTYYDDTSRQTVGRWFAVDVERFGYAFEPAEPAAPTVPEGQT